MIKGFSSCYQVVIKVSLVTDHTEQQQKENGRTQSEQFEITLYLKTFSELFTLETPLAHSSTPFSHHLLSTFHATCNINLSSQKSLLIWHTSSVTLIYLTKTTCFCLFESHDDRAKKVLCVVRVHLMIFLLLLSFHNVATLFSIYLAIRHEHTKVTCL